MLCDVTDALSFSLPFPSSRVPQSSSTVTSTFYICLRMIMLVFVDSFQDWTRWSGQQRLLPSQQV
jgi:hypothetical protein